MKKVNFKNVAKFVRFFLVVIVAHQIVGISVTLVKEIFNLKADFEIDGYEYGFQDYSKGYPVRMRLEVDIPKSINYYDNGTFKRVENVGIDYRWIHDVNRSSTDTINNQFVPEIFSYAKDDYLMNIRQIDKLSNSIKIPESVITFIKTDNVYRRIFFVFNDQIMNLFGVFGFLVMIRLINLYLKGNFLIPSSFKLISMVGRGLVYLNIVCFLCNVVSAYIIKSFNLVSKSLSSGNLVNTVGFHLTSPIRFDITLMLIGFLILVLSDIIKNSVFIKQEQDFTV